MLRSPVQEASVAVFPPPEQCFEFWCVHLLLMLLLPEMQYKAQYLKPYVQCSKHLQLALDNQPNNFPIPQFSV